MKTKKKLFAFCLSMALPALSFFSCSTAAGALRTIDPSLSGTVISETIVREEKETPPVPEFIMGKGLVSAQTLSEFLLLSNSKADEGFVVSLAEFYVKEAEIEGINHDVAFAQMCLETGYLQYGGLVQPEWNNFCGLGAISAQQPGLQFPDAATGVRAHIQHLKAYASAEPLKQDLVDPRYRYVRLGSSPKIEGLAGTWASDRQYAEKIRRILEKLYQFYAERL